MIETNFDIDQLIAKLNSNDQNVRHEGVKTLLSEIASSNSGLISSIWPAIPSLVQNHDGYVRGQAAKAAAAAAVLDPSKFDIAWNLLQPLFKDENPYVKITAAGGALKLAESHPEIAIHVFNELKHYLESDVITTVTTAISLLKKLVTIDMALANPVSLILLPYLTNESLSIKHEAFEALDSIIKVNSAVNSEVTESIQQFLESNNLITSESEVLSNIPYTQELVGSDIDQGSEV